MAAAAAVAVYTVRKRIQTNDSFGYESTLPKSKIRICSIVNMS